MIDNFYLMHFKNFDRESYLDFYLKKNQVPVETVRWMKGSDINFRFF